MDQENNTESIQFWKPLGVTGVEVLSVTNSHSLGKAFHENYMVSCSLIEDKQANAQIRYRGVTYRAPGKCCMFVEPGETTIVESQNVKSNYLTILVKPENVERLGIELLGSKRPSLKGFWRTNPSLENKLRNLVLRLKHSSSQLEQQTSLEELMISLFQKYGESSPKIIAAVGKPRLLRVRDYIVDNYNENINLEDLARIAGLSKWYLIYAFKQEFGFPPHTFQNMVRIAKVKSLLEKGVSQNQIDVGINSQSLLIKRFRETWGMTPGTYQRLVNSKNVK